MRSQRNLCPTHRAAFRSIVRAPWRERQLNMAGPGARSEHRVHMGPLGRLSPGAGQQADFKPRPPDRWFDPNGAAEAPGYRLRDLRVRAAPPAHHRRDPAVRQGGQDQGGQLRAQLDGLRMLNQGARSRPTRARRPRTRVGRTPTQCCGSCSSRRSSTRPSRSACSPAPPGSHSWQVQKVS